MADQNITALPVATSPTSSDQLLLVGATEEKLIDYDKLADAILTKLTSKQYTLDQGTKTLPAALNELNSKPQINEFSGNIDSLSGKYIVVANSYATGTLPKNLSGNRYFIMGDSLITSNGIIYGIQMAICFGSNSIAVRNSNYNLDGSKSYGEWRYI